MQLLWDGLVGAAKLLASGDALVIDAAMRSLWISITAVTMASVCGIPLGLMLARQRFFGRSAVVALSRTGMSVPTVLLGLLCYGFLARRGPLGDYGLLYTSWAIVIGEFFLALPIITCWTHAAVARLDPRVAETAWTLGASRWKRSMTYLAESREGIALAILTAFSRCFTELGIAVLVGGNLKYQTRTLTTATALESAQGEFERGVAMGIILFVLAFVVTMITTRFAGPFGSMERSR
jgi:tungstate transport system permease protein